MAFSISWHLRYRAALIWLSIGNSNAVLPETETPARNPSVLNGYSYQVFRQIAASSDPVCVPITEGYTATSLLGPDIVATGRFQCHRLPIIYAHPRNANPARERS